jgi:pentose-5-phosphate-3-epimerase
VIEEDGDGSQQLDSRKRKIDIEVDGGISKKHRSEDVIVVI